MIGRLRSFMSKCKRVFLVSSKPDKEEFKQSVRITGLGILIIGIIGFIIFIIVRLLGGL